LSKFLILARSSSPSTRNSSVRNFSSDISTSDLKCTLYLLYACLPPGLLNLSVQTKLEESISPKDAFKCLPAIGERFFPPAGLSRKIEFVKFMPDFFCCLFVFCSMPVELVLEDHRLETADARGEGIAECAKLKPTCEELFIWKLF